MRKGLPKRLQPRRTLWLAPLRWSQGLWNKGRMCQGLPFLSIPSSQVWAHIYFKVFLWNSLLKRTPWSLLTRDSLGKSLRTRYRVDDAAFQRSLSLAGIGNRLQQCPHALVLQVNKPQGFRFVVIPLRFPSFCVCGGVLHNFIMHIMVHRCHRACVYDVCVQRKTHGSRGFL